MYYFRIEKLRHVATIEPGCGSLLCYFRIEKLRLLSWGCESVLRALLCDECSMF